MTTPVVLITGALTGIGRATALAFAQVDHITVPMLLTPRKPVQRWGFAPRCGVPEFDHLVKPAGGELFAVGTPTDSIGPGRMRIQGYDRCAAGACGVLARDRVPNPHGVSIQNA